MAELKVVAIIENALFSIHWPDCEEHALDDFAMRLMDVEYLTAYFEQYPIGLKYYKTSISKALLKTTREVGELINELYDVAENSVRSTTKLG